MAITQEELDRSRQAVAALQQHLLNGGPNFDLDIIARSLAWLARYGEQLLIADGL